MTEKKDFFTLDPETFLERIPASDVSKIEIPDQSFEKEIPLIQVQPVLSSMVTIRDRRGMNVMASSIPGQTIRDEDGFYYISLKNDKGEYVWYLLK